MTRPASLVVVANRLPVELVAGADGALEWRPGVGGLVTTLEPVVGPGDIWIGWDGLRDATGPVVTSPYPGVRLHPLHLTPAQVEAYYEGYANATIWPLYHDRVADELAPPRFEPAWWDAYVAVNRRFAAAAASVAPPGATVWVNDYHLQLVPALLREARPDVRIGFFLYIPVPTERHFAELPERAELLRGMLGADLIGVNRPSSVRAFLRLVAVSLGLLARGGAISYGGRRVEVRAFPASVDVDHIGALASRSLAGHEVPRVREKFGDPRTLILGVERLDYTKGVGERLAAFAALLADGRLDARDTVHVQVAAPSRQGIPAYRTLRARIDEQVRAINARFGRPGRPVVHAIDEAVSRDDLVPLYLAADVMAVTPLRDSVNLVAKEYVAARVDLGGALVLSRFAGAADELRDAYLVDPNDPAGLADAIAEAVSAAPDERRARMVALRGSLAGHDARRWGEAFLSRLSA